MNVVPNQMAKLPYIDSSGFRQASSPCNLGDFGHNQLRSQCFHPIDHQSNPVSTSLYGASGSYYLICTLWDFHHIILNTSPKWFILQCACLDCAEHTLICNINFGQVIHIYLKFQLLNSQHNGGGVYAIILMSSRISTLIMNKMFT